MTTARLPIKLDKEPLVDAIFELRFAASQPMSNLLPGFLFAKLGETKTWKVEPLPATEIPLQIRSADPNLRFHPLVRIEWREYFILIGDASIGLSCIVPYGGWATFKERILEISKHLLEANLIDQIERVSLRYANVIDGNNLAEQIKKINMSMRIGSHQLKAETFNARIEIPDDKLLHLVQIAGPGTAKLRKSSEIRKGVVISVDTLCVCQTDEVAKFSSELPGILEDIHLAGKKIFFDCLDEKLIKDLGPRYE